MVSRTQVRQNFIDFACSTSNLVAYNPNGMSPAAKRGFDFLFPLDLIDVDEAMDSASDFVKRASIRTIPNMDKYYHNYKKFTSIG